MTFQDNWKQKLVFDRLFRELYSIFQNTRFKELGNKLLKEIHKAIYSKESKIRK